MSTFTMTDALQPPKKLSRYRQQTSETRKTFLAGLMHSQKALKRFPGRHIADVFTIESAQ